jgi:hypothetical protein
MQQEQPVPAEPLKEKKQNKSLRKWLCWLLVVLLLAVIGLLLWLWLTCHQHKKDLEDKNKSLQSQVDELSKKTAPEATPTTPEVAKTACPDVTDTFRENISAAVSSRNYAALLGSMTDPVTVVYAASEFGGPKTPAEAVAAMDYLNNGTAPWDFSLPAATLAAYRAGDYKQYFPAGAYIGKSSDGVMVSFGFKCDKINLLFISLNDLL